MNNLGFQVVHADGSISVGRTGPIMWCPEGLEIIRPDIPKKVRKWADRVLLMSGSVANYASKKLGDELLGATDYSADTTHYFGLWTSALDSTFNGATSGEAAYTSYARKSMTNNTTDWPAGSGTTSYAKEGPGSTESFPTSTGSTATVTYLGMLNGNAGTSSDKGIFWCSVSSTTINSGDTPQIASNAITVTFGG